MPPAPSPSSRRSRRPPCRSARRAGCGATRCRRATRSARCRSRAPTGYAAGDFGTLLHTTDGGATWTGLPSGTFTNLTEVQAIDADTVFAGGGCVARRSDDGGTTFKRLAFTPVESSCREQLAAGWFVNRRTGYLVLTDGTVLRTDNDGDTFAQKNPLPGHARPGGTRAPTDIVSWPTSGFAATSDGQIFRTVDGATRGRS